MLRSGLVRSHSRNWTISNRRVSQMMRLVVNRTTDRLEDASSGYIDVRNVSKLVLSYSKQIFEVSPFGDITFGELDILEVLDEGLGVIRKLQVTDDDLSAFSNGSFCEGEADACVKRLQVSNVRL